MNIMQLKHIEVIKSLITFEDIQREIGALAGKTNDRSSFVLPEEWRETYIGRWLDEELILCLGWIGYVTGDLLPADVGDGKTSRGLWDAENNEPELGASGAGGVDGDYYIVVVPGTTEIDGVKEWNVGDAILNNKDTTGIWERIEGGVFSSDFHKTLIKKCGVKRVAIRILDRAEMNRSRPGSPTYERVIIRLTLEYEEFEEYLRIVKKGIGGYESFPNILLMMQKAMDLKSITTTLNRPDAGVE